MVSLLLLVSLLFAPQAAKNDPNGVWQSDSGTKFRMTLTDANLKATLVDGSNPVYVKYEVDLKNTGEVNTYEGKGFFVAKVKDKECRFDTSWAIVVVQPATIAGYITHVIPEPGSCEVNERRDEFIQLKKVN
jgi:hypothetical protein